MVSQVWPQLLASLDFQVHLQVDFRADEALASLYRARGYLALTKLVNANTSAKKQQMMRR
jgi:hypothetical protein